MKIAGRIAVVAFGLSAGLWAFTRSSSSTADALGALLTITLGGGAVLIWLWREYQGAKPRVPGGPYLGYAILTCLVAAGLSTWSVYVAWEEKPVPVVNAGVVDVMIDGPTGAVDEYMGEWRAYRDVRIETSDDGHVEATLTLTSESSAPGLDLALELADGTYALCQSDKRVNWQRTDAGIVVELGCDIPVSIGELRTLRSVHLSASNGAGRMTNVRINPDFVD